MTATKDYLNLRETAELFGLSRGAFSEMIRRMGVKPEKRDEPGRTRYLSWEQIRDISRRTGIPIAA